MKLHHIIISALFSASMLTTVPSFANTWGTCHGEYIGYIQRINVGGERSNWAVIMVRDASGRDHWLANNPNADTPLGASMLSTEELAYATSSKVVAYCDGSFLNTIYIIGDEEDVPSEATIKKQYNSIKARKK